MKLKLFPIIFSFLLLAGCFTPDKEIKSIPKEFQGEWINHNEDFKLVITNKDLIWIDISTEEPDTNYRQGVQFFLTRRKDCSDCTNYGIKIKYRENDENEDCIYLDTFHPSLKKFLVLTLVESDINPEGNRGFYDEQIWKRIDL